MPQRMPGPRCPMQFRLLWDVMTFGLDVPGNKPLLDQGYLRREVREIGGAGRNRTDA